MKKYVLLLICLSVLFFVSCGENFKMNDLTNENQIMEYDYQETDRISKEVVVDQFSFNNKSNQRIYPYMFFGNKIYYAIDYSFYYDDPLGENKLEFLKEHNTEIHSYDLGTGEDKILYKYDEERCVSLWEMDCNGEYLIWEDNLQDEKWRILAIKLDEISEPVEIISYQEDFGENWNVSIEIDEDNVYWYDALYEREHPIILYSYNLKSEEIKVLKENLDLYSPYERFVVLDGIYSSYIYNSNETKIKVSDIKGNDILELTTRGDILNPLCNDDICIWMDADNNKKIYVYHIKEESLEIIKTNSIFSYAILRDYIFVNQQGGVLIYDVERKEYSDLVLSEDEKRKACLYSIMGNEQNVFCEKMNDDIEVSEILNFSVR